MRALARVVAEGGGHGDTRLTRLFGESPLLPRQTGGRRGPATVYLVGGAAGPLGGDELHLEVEVHGGATLTVRSAAASIALPARSGAPSRFTVSATVAAGATLRWLPEPTVAAAGCRHTSVATIDVADGGALVWRDELICGRHDEEPGNATIAICVCHAGRPLLRQALAIGPEAHDWAGPAVTGAAKALGSLLHVQPGTPPAAPCLLGPTAVRMPLAGPASLVTATAQQAHALRDILDAATGL